MELPKNILNIITSNKTSLGDNPALPPEMDDKFLVFLVNDYYKELLTHFDSIDIEELTDDLSATMTECKRIENENKEALEKICFEFVNNVFNIPSNTLSIDVELVDKIDTQQERLVPESSDNFSFDSIDDIHTLTNEIYKRRFLNALIIGAAMDLAEHYIFCETKLDKINETLRENYKKIWFINNLLLFHTKQSLSKKQKDGGNVDVYISDETTQPRIEAKAILSPILVEETIKGLLELAISHGLPKDKDKAEYVMGKADFKLAEVWDQRIGLPLWTRIRKIMEECNVSVNPSFLFMELASLETDNFNTTMQEILADTKMGRQLIKEIVRNIHYNIDMDDFDDYISNQQLPQDEIPMNDEEFTSDDLINDDICSINVMDEEEY